MAKAFPWYGYKKIALICQRLDEPIPRRRIYRIMKEAGLLHQRKQRIEARARQEVAKLYQLLPQRPNELWQTDVAYVRIPGWLEEDQANRAQPPNTTAPRISA